MFNTIFCHLAINRKTHQTEREKGKDYLLNRTTHPLIRSIMQNDQDKTVPMGVPDFRRESFESLNKKLALFSSKYDNFIIFGGFKVSFDDSHLSISVMLLT